MTPPIPPSGQSNGQTGQQPQAGQPPVGQQGQQPYNPYAQPPVGYPPYGQTGQQPQAGQPPEGQQGQQPYNPYAQPPVGYPPYPTSQEVVTTPIGSFGRSGDFKTKIKIPPHSLKFDENKFLRLMAGSISLSKDEKRRIIEAVPRLTQFQIDELIRILTEEKNKFSALDVKHKKQLRALEEKHAQEWEDLEMEMTEKEAKKNQEDQLARARAAATALNQQKPANNQNFNSVKKKSA